jgi:hypothetical protein
MHLFEENDLEKEGFEAILSDLALKVLYRMISACSIPLVHAGINPHFRSRIMEGLSEQIAGRDGRPKA